MQVNKAARNTRKVNKSSKFSLTVKKWHLICQDVKLMAGTKIQNMWPVYADNKLPQNKRNHLKRPGMQRDGQVRKQQGPQLQVVQTLVHKKK